MKALVHSGLFIALVTASGVALFVSSSAPVHADRGGNGNHYGWGRGKGRGGGGGGGPLPALGITLLGQAAGAAGLYGLWRRRRNKRRNERK